MLHIRITSCSSPVIFSYTIIRSQAVVFFGIFFLPVRQRLHDDNRLWYNHVWGLGLQSSISAIKYSHGNRFAA
ncbi:hypothetical protein LTS18_003659, partial [Coniosporium uncinatum]